MHRESVYVCSYTAGEEKQVAFVRAWDGREAAELFAREIELESGGRELRVEEISVRPVSGGDGAPRSIAG